MLVSVTIDTNATGECTKKEPVQKQGKQIKNDQIKKKRKIKSPNFPKIQTIQEIK